MDTKYGDGMVLSFHNSILVVISAKLCIYSFYGLIIGIDYD